MDKHQYSSMVDWTFVDKMITSSYDEAYEFNDAASGYDEEFKEKILNSASFNKTTRGEGGSDNSLMSLSEEDQIILRRDDPMPEEYSVVETRPEVNLDRGLEDMDNQERNLALRNIKLNFGTGLIQFCEFQCETAHANRNKAKEIALADLACWLKTKQIEGSFRSFKGWRDIWTDKEFGKATRKLSKLFFGRSFVKIYVGYSRIKPEYKAVYRRKAQKFYEGAKRPESFIPQKFSDV